jgi:hypothetical protein
MEADDILMNISEIESPNYEYVELDLLNLPRDLSTNLNEDSDNQKENSCYWTDRNRANTENIRIGLVFVVLAQ